MLTVQQTHKIQRHRRFTPRQAHWRRWLWKRLETGILLASSFVAGAAWGALLLYAHLVQWPHGIWLAWASPLVVGVVVGGSWALVVEHSAGWEEAHGLPLVEARLALPPTARLVLQRWEHEEHHALLVRDLRRLARL